jgi:competence protein ComEC
VQKLIRFWREIACVILLAANCFCWYVFLCERPNDYFTVAVLNIGQGDSIYIESPTHNRMMVDGGPPHAVLSELRKVIPFYEHHIDTLLITNPDADHYAGFIDVLNSYGVDRVIEPGTKTLTETYKIFDAERVAKNIPKIIARRGMVIHLGSSTNLTILYPDRDVSAYSTNDGSIVAKLAYGSTSVMLTGDAPSPVEEYVLAVNGPDVVKSTLLKVGHHGSRTSASDSFISAVAPQAAMISAGLNNMYGHPHKETLDLLNKYHIPALITFEEGTIIYHCTMQVCTRQ